MKAKIQRILVGCFFATLTANGWGAEISLIPVSASGVHTITGNEIRLQGAGQRVFLEVRISGWTPSQLRAYQAALNSSGYSSAARGTLTPARALCTSDADCQTAFGQGSVCDVPPGAGVECTPGFIDNFRSNYVFACCSNLPAVDIFTPDYRYAATVISTNAVDPGTVRYAGTLVLDVPADAVGSFTVGWFPAPDTFLQDPQSDLILPLNLSSAKITITCQIDANCDDGNACTTDRCLSQLCSNQPNYNPATQCCNPANGVSTLIEDGNQCTSGTCNPSTGQVTQQSLPSGTFCGNPAADACDLQDTCNATGVCVNRFAATGTSCGSPANTQCDNPDSCDGAGVCRTNVEPAGTFCGSAVNTECNLRDTCDGTGICLTNIRPAGTTCGNPSDTECDNPDACDGNGSCLLNNAPSGLPCGNPIGNQCDDPDTCNGTGACSANNRPTGTTCGNPANTECDNPDVCNGTGTCVANNEPDGTTCTDDGNECRADVCQAGVCAHPFKPSGSGCGSPGDTDCDNPDSCDGAGVCRQNREPAGAACGDPATTDCNGADSCDGNGVCLANLRPSGAACGNPVDTDCDNPDTCDGAGACRGNFAPPGLPCGNQVGNQCDNPDTCDGSGTCNQNFVSLGTACGSPADTECDNPDRCNGAGVCSTNREPEGTACTDDGNQCRDDVCLSGVCSHPLKIAGSLCGDPTGTECNGADSCDGTGTCLINLAAAGTSCGDPADTACTNPDTCNGFGSCLANNALDGTSCDDGSFCNAGARCVGGACGGGSAVNCDDGLPCTADSCNEALRRCDNILQPGNCLIDAACYLPGELNPLNECQVCDPSFSPINWASVAAGTLCDDGDPCTGTGEPGIGVDTCDGLGVCSGTVDPDCNDDCVNAVEVFDGRNIGNNAGRGPDDAEASCRPESDNDVWFFYDPTCTGTVVMDTIGSSFQPVNDTVLSVYNACGGAEIACDDDSAPGLQSLLSFNALLGVRYFVRVAGFLENAGDFVLNIATINGCVIAGVCVAPGTINPDNQCEACLPFASSTDWSPRAAGSACGDPTDNECDSPDACDGLGVCEANHKADQEICPDDGNDCTNDVCFAGACTHPPHPVGTACGSPLTTQCDNPDTCDGAGSCMANYAPLGLACGDPSTSDCDNADICNGFGACDPNHQPDGITCTDDGVQCTLDVCLAGLCVHPPAPLGTSCGDGSNTQCDQPDSCDGLGNCQPNYAPTGTACGDPTNTECDNPDTCNGFGTCVGNLEPIGTACGDPTDTDCDNADTCNGAGGCLDNLEVSGFPCGDPSNTQCDQPDTCDGGGVCLSNFRPQGTTCGDPSTSDCDNPDICNGSGACDPNHQPDGLQCTDDGNDCTFEECRIGVCTHPSLLAGTPCGDPTGTQCDQPDTCNGAGVCLTNFRSLGTACGDPTDTPCDNPDACNGFGACVTNLEPPGFACGDPTNTDCDNPDTCDGAGVCLDNLEVVGFPCGDQNNTQCDRPDTCDAIGVCLSNFVAADTPCGDPAVTECDNADRCDGQGACDPNHQPDGLACTPDTNQCSQDICVTGVCAHPDQPPGTPCDDADICTGNDVCNLGSCAGTAIPQASLVDGNQPRYILVTPQPAGSVAPVALRVTSPDYPCLDRYISLSGLLVSTPTFQTPAQWGTVLVRSANIIPDTRYQVVAECGSFTSPPGEARTSIWGDVVGPFVAGAWTLPDGRVDITSDVTAVLDKFRNAATAPAVHRVDLVGAGLFGIVCPPDGRIDIIDVMVDVDAFRNISYTQSTHCPGPCIAEAEGSVADSDR